MEKKVDLHIHSIYSDGCNTPRELMELAMQNNIGIMAITDHDSILGSKELMKLPDMGIVRYSGTELTAKVSKGRMHILGYNIDLDNEELNRRLDDMKKAAVYNLLMYVDVLKRDFGICIPMEKLEPLVNSKSNVGRPQLALLLIELGYCKTVDEAFDVYLRYALEKVRKAKVGLTKEECVELINKAGGVASLAHPCSLLMDEEELEKEIEYLQGIGLKAIEIQHIHTSDKDRKFYYYLANKYGLLETGGTDYHGPKVKPDVMLGTGKNNNVNIGEETLSLVLKVKSRY